MLLYLLTKLLAAVTYPLDMLKTRLQVFGELSNQRSHPGLFRIASSVIKNEGILELWQGLSPALCRHLIYTGARIPIYEFVRSEVFHLPPASHVTPKHKELAAKGEFDHKSDPVLAGPDGGFGFAVRAALTGVIAGSIAQLLASPTDLLKVRFQTERRWMSEKKIPGVADSVHNPTSIGAQRLSLIRTTRQLMAESGIRGLWKGGLPNVQRAALVNMGELTTYDSAKRWFAVKFQLDDGPLLHFCASSVSGFVAAFLGTPADLIKTRIMNQRNIQTGPTYSGVLDCARKVIQTEGFFAMYKGFFLIWGRLAPWSLTFWLTYEKIREVLGVGGF